MEPATSSEEEQLRAENQRLRKEINLMRAKLAAFEHDENQVPPTSDKQHVARIFSAFDTDKDGFIDQKELRELALQLGESATEGEINHAMAQIDLNKDGVISFEEFYTWWSAEEEAEEGKAHQKEKEEDEDEHGKRLRALRLKLRSQPYMRTVLRLMDKVNHKVALSLATNQLHSLKQTEVTATENKKGKDKRKLAEEETKHPSTFSANVNVTVGTFGSAPTTASLHFECSEEKAEAARKEFVAPEDSAIISLGLTINDNVDDFELGELSGSLKDILSVLTETFHYRGHKVQLVQTTNDKGEKQREFRVSLIFFENEGAELLTGFLTAAQLKEMDISLELSQSPTTDTEEFLSLRASLNAVVGITAIDFFHSLLSHSDNGQERADITDVIALFTALRNVGLNFKFDNVEDMYRQAFQDTDFAEVTGWQSGKRLLIPWLKSILGSCLPLVQ
ncbi:hypothetical protein QOT17_009613 [Balamuthia mandrillaris]